MIATGWHGDPVDQVKAFEYDTDADTFTRWDRHGVVLELRPLTAEERTATLGDPEARARDEALDAHRDALAGARELLRAYGTPQGLGFAQTYSAVQTAVLDYRDSGIVDPVCEEHRGWMVARVGEITAAALYAAGVLR
jgi:hypothetical protein